MTSRTALCLAACLAIGTVFIAADVDAQSLLEFDRWMQKIEKRSLSMQRSLKRKDAPAALADAAEIGDLYRRMEAYFVRRGDAAPAVKLSREGMDLVAEVSRSASDTDFDGALRSAITLARACRDCHADYKPLD